MSADVATETRAADRRRISRPGADLLLGLGASLTTLALGMVRSGRSFSYDEGYTYYFFINGGSPWRALSTQIVFNNHPMFSAVQSIGWRVGLVGETAQRLGPVTWGAVTVGLVAWFTARRVGVTAGLVAATVLVLGPEFFEQYRQLRGYSLAMMAVTIAAIALHASFTDERRRWLVVHGVFAVVAVTTHSYSALTLAVLGLAAIAAGRIRRDHLVTWAMSIVGAVAVAFPVLDDARANAEARGNRFVGGFPIDLWRGLTGGVWPAVVITSIAIVAGAVTVARRSRRDLIGVVTGVAAFVAPVLVIWSVLQPFDLYTRFFSSLLPILAVLAGLGVASIPAPARVAAAVLLAVLLVPRVGELIDSEATVRHAAEVTDRARALGLDVCGRHVEPLAVYTPPIRVALPPDLAGCDVYVSVLGMTREVRRGLGEAFGASVSIGGSISIWADQAVIDQLAIEVP